MEDWMACHLSFSSASVMQVSGPHWVTVINFWICYELNWALFQIYMLMS